jgi:hypothetical protein
MQGTEIFFSAAVGMKSGFIDVPLCFRVEKTAQLVGAAGMSQLA